MARLALCVALVALSACKREPTFEERYAKAQEDVAAKARAIDRELEDRAPAAPAT